MDIVKKCDKNNPGNKKEIDADQKNEVHGNNRLMVILNTPKVFTGFQLLHTLSCSLENMYVARRYQILNIVFEMSHRQLISHYSLTC